MRSVLLRATLLCAIGTVAASNSAGDPNMITGLISPSGDACLVKRFTVPAGAAIVGIEFLNNDDRTEFPTITLLRGPATRLADAVLITEATGVRATSRHRVRVSVPRVRAEGSEVFYVAVRFPPNNGATVFSSGAGIAATQLDTFGDSYVASTPEERFQSLDVDLAIALLFESAGKVGSERETRATVLTFLATPSPNPTASRAQVQFGLDQRMPVRLGIFNIAGRLVRLLTEGPYDAGLHALEWDGRDEHGQRVAAGVYVAKLHAGGEVITQKIVVMK